jgi:dihydroxyacetone kinase
MGIHNEPGSHRMKFSLPEVIKTMLWQILDHNDPDRAFLTHQPGDEFVLLINNLGGVSTLELSGITDEVYRQLTKDFNIKPARIIQGTFLTSLNGLGFSVSLLKLADTGLGPGKSMLELLDAPAEAVGWSAPIRTSTWEAHQSDAPVEVKNTKLAEDQPSKIKRESPHAYGIGHPLFAALIMLQWTQPFSRKPSDPHLSESLLPRHWSPGTTPSSGTATAAWA